MSLFIVDIHEITYATSKGIWTIESTVEDLCKALANLETSLVVLPDVPSEEYFNKYDAFLAP
eukprot:2885662-Ditylum_brightwellii.AAC.1